MRLLDVQDSSWVRWSLNVYIASLCTSRSSTCQPFVSPLQKSTLKPVRLLVPTNDAPIGPVPLKRVPSNELACPLPSVGNARVHIR
jgi:hypothetical protein